MFDRYAYISMYLISKLVFINIVCYSVVLFYWKLEWSGYFCTISSVSKSKTNGEYYQKSDYRLLRINTLFLIW